MNKMKFICYMAAACIGGGFISCQSEDPWSGQTQSGFVVSLADAGVEATTRQTPEDLRKDLKQDAFTLSVVRQNTGEEVYNGPCGTGPIPAKAGVYTLSAHYGDDPVLALDAPYYTGKVENVTLNGNEVKQVSIPCQVGNALLSVKYENTDKIENHYSAYGVAVEVGEESVEIDHTSNKSAYFKAGSSVKLYFKGTWKESGEEKSMELATKLLPKTFAAGDHAIVTLRISPDMTIEITKVDVTEATIDATIPGEWLPKPKVEAVGFTEQRLDMYETETPTARFNFQLSSALQELVFTLTFGDETYQTLNKTYTLSTLTKEERTALTEAGIVLPEIGATEASLDFTALAAKLTGKQGETVENVITLDKVQANDRVLEGEQTYTIRTSAPEFTIAVQPENVWSKEFTIDEATINAGNEETIKNRLKYQYRENGTDEWKDCERLVQFAKHPTNKKYQVRAIYRDGITSEPIDVELEIPTQLPNSDMEQWHTEVGGEFNHSESWLSKKTYYKFYPYASGENDIWWDTNNLRSQDGNIVFGLGHPTSFSPCVSYSESEKYEGSRSALIYTSGHGGGDNSTGEVIYEEGAFAGSLFIGSYSWSGGTETINQGHAFAVRPTTFTFYYRYYPKGSDTFKAYIEIKNGDEVVATGTFTPKASSEDSGWQQATVTLGYVESPKTATSIYVQFLSTTKTSFSEDDFDRNKSITFPVMGDWSAHIGSMLYIDNLSLIYDK